MLLTRQADQLDGEALITVARCWTRAAFAAGIPLSGMVDASMTRGVVGRAAGGRGTTAGLRPASKGDPAGQASPNLLTVIFGADPLPE